MGDDWTEVTIRGVVIDPTSGEPTVLLDDTEQRSIIAVPADPANAVTIISELEGIGRDLTNAVLYRFFVRHGVQVRWIGISRSRDGNLAASIHYRFQNNEFSMEVRPEDGLLIGLQSESPVFAANELITSARTGRAPRVKEAGDLLILSRRSSD